MGLRGEAAIIGFVELAPERKASRPPMFSIEQYASLSQGVLHDAGVDPRLVDGLVCSGLAESRRFAPATLAEYLGIEINLNLAYFAAIGIGDGRAGHHA